MAWTDDGGFFSGWLSGDDSTDSDTSTSDSSTSSDSTDSTTSDSTTSDSTTSDSTTNDGGGFLQTTWSDLSLPGWLTDLQSVSDTLVKFAKNPIGFILGAVLTYLLAGVEAVVTAFGDAIMFVFEGDTVGSTEGMLGLADAPRIGADLITDAGSLAGSLITGSLSGLFTTLEAAARAAGPAAPLVIGIAFGGTLIASAYLTRILLTLARDTLWPL